MIWVERQFVSRIAPYVKNFKQKDQYLWNFSCPMCGDVSKGRQKMRGYVYRAKHQLNYKCHHCGVSISFGSFLKSEFPNLYKEFVVEKYKNSPSKHEPHTEIKKVVTEHKSVDTVLQALRPCSKLKDSHPVSRYLANRLLPKEVWDKLYYTTAFKHYANSVIPGSFKSEENDKPRLIFPYFDKEGKVFAFAGRAFDDEQPKYITLKFDENAEKIYGLERISGDGTVLAVEGQIDSLFLPNCIAVSGAGFNLPTIRNLRDRIIVVLDNEPRNREIVASVKKMIDNGFTVCMMPDLYAGADINDLVKAGLSVDQIVSMIKTYSFSGQRALLEFAHWKRV